LLAHLEEWKPDVVLQDLLLPGGMDGVETTRRITERAPWAKVVALTASTDEARMMGVLRAGAAGYVRKDADPEILLAAVRAVARGRTYIDPSVILVPFQDETNNAILSSWQDHAAPMSSWSHLRSRLCGKPRTSGNFGKP
jgi:DNA-binding NarL/FixJ family response regulator